MEWKQKYSGFCMCMYMSRKVAATDTSGSRGSEFCSRSHERAPKCHKTLELPWPLTVASFLVLGYGVCTDRKTNKHVKTNIHYFKIHMYIYTINAVPVPCYNLWYGDNTINVVPFTILVWRYKQQYYRQTLVLRKIYMNVRAIGASELRKFSHFHLLKLLFPSILCWYFRYFASET